MRYLGLGALLLAAGCVKHWSAGTSPLAVSLRQELESPAPLSELTAAKSRHYLFVGGFLNEAIPGYFADNLAVVTEQLGASASTLFPSSAASMEDDARQIRDAVNAAYEARHKPIVLVGHSKGAASSVLAVLQYPELAARVDRIIAIQGAFQGSPLADGLLTSMPIPFVFKRLKGLPSLSPSTTKATFAAALAKPREEPFNAWLASRVFYVRSWEAAGDVAYELAITHEFLSKYGSRHSDGLLLEEAQKLDGVGRDLGVLKGDHAAFVVRGPLSNSSADERRAFTRALLRLVFSQP
jgi:pimeloyl-ACP methyl ester carboxylesterase